MTFRHHDTDEEKEDRNLRYRLLRNSGIPPRLAHIFRDWTDNKIMKIALGEAQPIR